jgi:hypothetical protein
VGAWGFRRKNRLFALLNPSYRTGASGRERLPRSAKIN